MDYHFLKDDFNKPFVANRSESSFLEVTIPFNLRNAIQSWGRNTIKSSDLFIYGTDYGFEHRPHISLLYDIKTDDVGTIEQIVKKFEPPEIKLGKITKFPHKTAENTHKYDVIKISVNSPSLIAIHEKLKKQVPNDYEYSSYIPHITIAYVNVKSCDYLLGNDYWEGTTFTARYLRFADTHNKSYIITLF